MTSPVHNAEPPRWMVEHVVNPLMRRVVPTPLGRRVPVALLRFTGRRTGRRYEIPVGVHEVEGALVVFTPARWAANFEGGAVAELVRGGRCTAVRGVLVREPAQVGTWLRAALSAAPSPRRVGLSVPDGYVIDDEEAARLRHAIRLDPA
jgi:hypothetical protein